MKSYNKKHKPKYMSKSRWYLSKYLFSVNMNKRVVELCGLYTFMFIKHCETKLVVDSKAEHCSLDILHKRFKHWEGQI